MGEPCSNTVGHQSLLGALRTLQPQEKNHKQHIVQILALIDYQDTNICASRNTTEDLAWHSIGHEDIPTVQIPPALVLPKRISCENPGELFIILPNEIPNNPDIEVEFSTENQLIRRKAIQCNQHILCLKALDFPPGPVMVKVCCGEVITATAQIEYFSATEDLECLLSEIVDPIKFFCQAFNIYTMEELDKVLVKSLQDKISSCEIDLFQINQHTINTSSEEIPTLLHCAAKLGLKEVTCSLMQSPVADYICQLPNKYGDDPAAIAKKHGHHDIQDIIHRLAEIGKGNQTDTPRELVEFEHGEVYVDMDECADQQSLKDWCGKEQKENLHQMSETEREAHVYPVIKCPEKNGGTGKHSECRVSDGTSDMIDDYCLLGPADNPSGPFTNDLSYVLQGEVTKTDTDEEWCATAGMYNSECRKSWQENSYEPSSESHNNNLYIPLPVHSVTGDLPSPQYDRSITASPLPGDNLPMQLTCSQEEETSKEKMLYDAPCEYPDEGNDGDYNEELVTVTSTEDDVYIVFETSSKSLIAPNSAAPGAISDPAIERGASYITEEESKDHDDENVLYNELDNHSDEGKYNEHDEEELVVAATEDNVYIVFETSIKDKQKGQKAPFDHNSPDPEDKSNCTTEMNASYMAQAEGSDDCTDRPYFWDEIDEEDPYSLTFADDDLYIELPFETTDRESTKGKKSFIVHRAPAPAPRPQQQQASPNIEESNITGAEGSDDCTDRPYFWDEIDEEDPYSLTFADDDLYIELPLETTDRESTKGKKSFIVHRAPAPAPRPQQQQASPNIEDSYITRVFCQKEKNIYGTGLYQGPEVQGRVGSFWPAGENTSTVHAAKPEAYVPPQQCVPSGQDELIMLQEQVKLGIISMDEALQKFHQWQKEKSGLDLLQQKKLQQQHDNIIGDTPDVDKVYGTVHAAKPEAYVPPQQCVPSGQDELIMLQEQVKLGIISMDEALQKFHHWQNEKSGLDLLQQKKLQQLRDNIIGDKPDDDKVYDKITIVHQPKETQISAFNAKHRGTAMFDSSIYQKPHKPTHHSQYPLKRDNRTSEKSPFSK
ncbi:B-cell scaffold protein with ankyrin repeats [Pseudophryne corroboree]|uniref:B-cell scaffold protein with ankyrin repeats n=1 Tax=Pseudophryne corroboree TaxID=495146 RepID=UPI003081AAAE